MSVADGTPGEGPQQMEGPSYFLAFLLGGPLPGLPGLPLPLGSGAWRFSAGLTVTGPKKLSSLFCEFLPLLPRRKRIAAGRQSLHARVAQGATRTTSAAARWPS